MGGHGKTLAGERGGEDLFFGVNKDIVDPGAPLANEVLVAFHHGIEVLRATYGQRLEFSLGH
jgi:hypothetical protein